MNQYKQNTDWVCISGKKAGPITANTTESELKKIFGNFNVTSSKKLVAEGTKEIVATYIYKGTKNELEISWKDNKQFKEIAGVVFYNNNTSWKTNNGITIGTTLDELNIINGKPFKFYGFEWDMGGWVFDWGNGYLEGKKIGIDLELTKIIDNYSDYLGHVEISSANKDLKKFKIKVSKVYVTL